jgi:hypothetical protein
MPPVPSPP